MGNDNVPIEERKSKIREKFIKEKIKDIDIKIKEKFEMETEDFLHALCDKKYFKEKFLISHYKMYNLLQEIKTEIKELTKKQLTEIQIQEAIEKLTKKKIELADSRIELYICNVMGPGHEFIKFCADCFMTYGLVHVGILLDDICLQWGRGIFGESIVYPSKTVIHNDYIYAIELENKQIWDLIKETFNNLHDYISGRKKFEEMGILKAFEIADSQLDIIAEISTKYNVEKTYNIALENCQHFVKKIIKKLNLKVFTEGEVGRVLKIAEDKGDIIDFVYKDQIFNNRKELDDYITKCKFENLPNDHRRLLFCYNNVFDYYSRYRNEDKYKTTEELKLFWRTLSCREKFEN